MYINMFLNFATKSKTGMIITQTLNENNSSVLGGKMCYDGLYQTIILLGTIAHPEVFTFSMYSGVVLGQLKCESHQPDSLGCRDWVPHMLGYNWQDQIEE